MFEFDFGHGEDLDLLRETVRSFAADRIAPRAAEIDEKNEFPRDLWPELGELGLLGITVEGRVRRLRARISRARYCYGRNQPRLGFGRACPMARIPICASISCSRWGSDEQKQRLLPKLVSGEFLGALAMSEPGAGSDVMGMRTTAVRDGDDYVLNGSKMWITNAPGADVIIVYAKTEPGTASKKHQRLSCGTWHARASRRRRSSTSSVCAAPTQVKCCSRTVACLWPTCSPKKARVRRS